MELLFSKYQGAGNDFIIIDNRSNSFPKNNIEIIRKLCDRRFGVGADGLILLENSTKNDFTMVYYNADGNESTMCGNGGRCIVAFAKHLDIIGDKTIFDAIDGKHVATIKEDMVRLQMIDIDKIDLFENHTFLNTGSPHHISFDSNIDKLDIKKLGKKIRYGAPYFEEGTNVNFVEQISDNSFKIRTYERGVENETLACGTGATAVAIAANKLNKTTLNTVKIEVLGGSLEVSFKKAGDQYKNVFLKGPAQLVFKGNISI
ncbi:diaminopimelate epimerase [Lutibacter profundi]|uniref:Diaminopimelate epimerase n=1 Tax=Lutibacter profundi TaxID=1622118 RepID=A0A0X8G481_9FLAO|nr:diaminopimelate epimerase [Lutibacter profundi]AMC09749.1 diaminopimelate epimerase [Lutibacter profundi]